MDVGLGSAPLGQETLLGPEDGGCGGSEVKCEGDAEKAADIAMRGDSIPSSRLDDTSTTKKGKKRKSATPSTLTTSGLGSGCPARVEADGSAGYNAKAPKVVPRSKGLGFPIRLPTIVDLQQESSPVKRMSKPYAAPYQSVLLRQILDSQRVPVHPEKEDQELDDKPELEQDSAERDPDYVPRRGDKDDEGDTSDNEIRRDQPCKVKGKSDLRGKVPAVTCPMPDCFFFGSNVRLHLRGQPHLFIEAQI